MDKKQKNTGKKMPLTIAKREPGKAQKTDFMQNLRPFPTENKHPVEDLLGFSNVTDLDTQTVDNLGTPNIESLAPQAVLFEQPKEKVLDAQEQKIGHPNVKNLSAGSPEIKIDAPKKDPALDSQNKRAGQPKVPDLDIQIKNLGQPNTALLDIQEANFGNPKTKNLDSKISKKPSRISKPETDLDSLIAEEKISDIQNEPAKTDWSKYDRKRKAKGVFLRTSDEITKKFKQFCIKQDWDFSYGTEIAWNKLMLDLDIQSESDLDSLIALDDRRLKMMYKSKPFIINLYLRYNGIFNELAGSDAKGKWAARWFPRDDEAGQKYNEISPAIIELGIIQTQTNKGFGHGRIQTFKYYTEEIDKVLLTGVSDEMLDTILSYHRQMWQKLTGREVDLKFLQESN